MNSEQCQAFMKVVELGSFAKAAQRLYVTPQAVSQQVARLEREVGVELFARSSVGAQVTAAGRIFDAWCRETEVSYADALRRCREQVGPAHRAIRLGNSRAHTLSLYKRVVNAFLRTDPAASIEFVDLGTVEPIDLLLDKLRDDVCDVVEWVDPQADDLGFLPLESTHRCCLLSPRNPLSHHDLIRPEDLLGQKVYVYSERWARNLRSYLDEHCPGVELVAVGAPDSPAMMRTYLTGSSVYLLPEQLRDLYENLVSVPLGIDLTTTYGLAYRLADEGFLIPFLESARRSFSAGA